MPQEEGLTPRQKYLSEFYSTKVTAADLGIFADSPQVEEPGTCLEYQIHGLIILGNGAYLGGRYQEALDRYLQAWGLLPKLVYPLFPGPLGRIKGDLLLEFDLTEHLTSAAAEIHKWRGPIGSKATITSTVPAPEGLVELSDTMEGDVGQGRRLIRLGQVAAEAGSFDEARRHLDGVLQIAGDDLELQADAHLMLAAVELRQANPSGAYERLDQARTLYERAARDDGVAATQHNLGVMLTLQGSADEAARMFANSASNVPKSLGWQVTQTLNPGIASFTREMGAASLPFMVKDAATGGWSMLAGKHDAAASTSASILLNGTGVQLDLTGDATSQFKTMVYDSRVNQATLDGLSTYLGSITQFVTYLAHVQGFVLPLALGDTYAGLGDYSKAVSYYLKARDYRYLNLPIERPMLWAKTARAIIQLGNRLYRDRDPAAAQAQYERIVKVLPGGGFDLTGALYSGTFADLTAETMAFLAAPDKVGFTAMDFARRSVLMEALGHLTQIQNNINYLGFPDEIVPIHSWRYLQNVARYLATQAVQAERSFITFRDNAEKEAFTRLALEQGVDAQAAALDVEEARVNAALAQQAAARSAKSLAGSRLDNAEDQRQEYEGLSQELVYLEEIIAFTNASGLRDMKVRINSDWANLLGIDPGHWNPNDLIQLLTRRRSQLSREYELRNMDRQIEELEAALTAATDQVAVAQKMTEVATAQQELAELRLDQAKAQLEHFDSEEFTPELWDNLAQAQRELSRRYLDRAIGAAFLMERAFEYQYDTEVNRIRFDYQRSELHGLLAADFLLADIDEFSFDRLLETKKRLPIKVTIPLAERYPFPFSQQFQRTGRLEFQTLLEEFDQQYPGAHLATLRRVEVVVEGLIGPEGLHGRLTNAGTGFVRDRQGRRRMRLQPPETLLLSRFDLRSDGFVFTADEDVLDVFENSALATGWVLEFPPDANDVDLSALGNVHLVLYAEAFHSNQVADTVRAELGATALYQHTLGLSLSAQFPDEFFGFQDAGQVRFTVDNAYLPFNHTEPRLRELQLRVQSGEEGAPAGLNVRVERIGGAAATQATDVNGMVGTGDGAALNALRGASLTGEWLIRIDLADNPGFDPASVDEIVLFAEYDYTPRGRPASGDAFDADPMADFDAITDAAATTGGPAVWSYDPAGRLIRQTSGVHGPGASPTSPDKPGTFLIRKTAAAIPWPALRDLTVHSRLRSDDPDGIGLIFRYQDPDNFYFLLMDSARHYRRLGKKVAGTFQELATPAVDLVNGYPVGEVLDVTVSMVGDAVVAYLNGQEILRGWDGSIMAPGRVGCYAWANQQAHFLDLAIRPV
ncbi:hypothetical protein [Actinomadura sp. 9N215]|uniref:Tc toxin subunit A-related protein n=1 Tax=Actinomadura sp. 9N215 TaxID=3375150 RepID=UPI003788CE9F